MEWKEKPAKFIEICFQVIKYPSFGNVLSRHRAVM